MHILRTTYVNPICPIHCSWQKPRAGVSMSSVSNLISLRHHLTLPVSRPERHHSHHTQVVHCSTSPAASMKTVKLTVKELTKEAFQPFGQVVTSTDDGKQFDHTDAQLDLNQGTPRFYIMRLPKKGLAFDRITYHGRVTQCLGALTAEPWYLAVAATSGSLDQPPTPEQIQAFRVPHGQFVKLERGTWHAGPLFDEAEAMSFYNLELADTNVVDHHTHVFSYKDGIVFELDVGHSGN